MATATRKCKVCGCEYEYCHTNRRVAGVFRYQDVACCPVHGSIYFARFMESRSNADTSTETVDVESEQSAPVIYESDEDDNELFEEDFDDNMEEPAIETR